MVAWPAEELQEGQGDIEVEESVKGGRRGQRANLQDLASHFNVILQLKDKWKYTVVNFIRKG